MKKTVFPFLALMGLFACQTAQPERFPAHRAKNVNPDTKLVLCFNDVPQVGTSGMIRIIDIETGMVADSLDMSIPAGPTTSIKGPKAPYASVPYDYTRERRLTNRDVKPGTPSGCAAATADTFQLTIIGGFTDAFHFYPVTVEANRAIVHPHHDLLEYGKTYEVRIDESVLLLPDGSFSGIAANEWRFSTKAKAPEWRSGGALFSEKERFVVVDACGGGDFNTVQAALDFVPDNSKDTLTIYIKNGNYEELVYFRNKSNLRIIGESREGVLIHYPNNELFNPHPVDVSTNEWPGTFPSRRAAFAADNCRDLYMANLTLQTDCRGQAEGLLVMGERNTLYNVRIVGDGDALQANGSLYMEDCQIDGGGDTMLGRGPVFLRKCSIKNNGGPFMWIRNTAANHGNVFVQCTFLGNAKRASVLARAPLNGGPGYPYSEAVLIDCVLDGVPPVGWGPVEGDTKHVRYWEYNSKTLDGKPLDVSQRSSVSRQLTMEKDSALIEQYSTPSFVLGGWTPKIR